MIRLVTIFIIFSINVHALELNFSVPQIPENINLLSSKTEVEKIVMQATTFSLYGYLGTQEINEYSLIENYSSNSLGNKFSFLLKNSVRFANSNLVLLSDIVFSINSCNIENLKSIETEVGSSLVTLIFNTTERVNISKLISKCPILEKNNSLLFKKEYGKHSTVSSVSHYKIYRFVPGKRIELIKHDNSIDLESSPNIIDFTKYANPRKALTKLRVGSIDIILSNDLPVIELAKNDKTLKVVACDGNSLIMRESLNFDCINYTKIEYQQ